MKTAVRLFLVRHGQVSSNRDLRYVGSRDEPLTELGERQARRLGEALSSLELDRLVTSPLRRCRRTAEAIAEASGLVLEVDDRLREQSFGEWEGMSRDEVRERSAEDRERLAAWESDPAVAPPAGESLSSVQARVVALVRELSDAASDEPPSVVLVTHVGPIKGLLAAALDVPLPKARRLFLDPATISVIDWGEPSVVRLCNSHAHLGWTEARWM